MLEVKSLSRFKSFRKEIGYLDIEDGTVHLSNGHKTVRVKTGFGNGSYPVELYVVDVPGKGPVVAEIRIPCLEEEELALYERESSQGEYL